MLLAFSCRPLGLVFNSRYDGQDPGQHACSSRHEAKELVALVPGQQGAANPLLRRFFAADGSRKPSAAAENRTAARSCVRAVMTAVLKARPSLIPSLCTHFARAGIEWRR